MQAHFGTDGIRGRANETLTVGMAYRIGQFLAQEKPKGRILIGRDTRLSSGMLQSALASGITACGSDVYLLEVCSTPALVYLVKKEQFDFGIMITASHNPYYDNGIKIISSVGSKIDSRLEQEIENYIYSEQQIDLAIGQNIGRLVNYHQDLQFYYDYLYQQFPLDLSDYSLIVDCANGSNSEIASVVFKHLNAKVELCSNQPDGLNINKDCGSTHIDRLAKLVKEGNYDVGFGYDGDGDRVIAVAKDGQIVDGDKILYCCGKYLQSKNQLTNGKIVTTVMANLGLFKKLDEYGIGYEKTAVGDKYVYQCMKENGYVIGGEQSGHIIFSNHATTGDGLLTSLVLLSIMLETKQSLNQLTDDLYIYPQILINVPVSDKNTVLNDQRLTEVTSKVQTELADNGRVLVRASGTESLIRVMIEADSKDSCQKYADEIVEVVKQIEDKGTSHD
ncbi:MAG: phosphoglucosamine mutase [Erysipelotrichaceae bacterium]